MVERAKGRRRVKRRSPPIRPPRRMSAVDPIRFAAPDVTETEADSVTEVLRSGWIVGGSRLQELEGMFAERCGRRLAIGVTSWTTGAFAVLHAWGIGPGDEVIVPSYSFIATANVVRHVGATPVFADIDPDTWNIDPGDVEAKVTNRTRAVIPVDQIGLPCDMEAINDLARKQGLHVLQDAACAVGSVYKGREVGADAEAAVFSMHARKLITTGEGGMIVTDDDAFVSQLRLIRHQGMSISDLERHGSASTRFEEYPIVGYNFRLTDIQAAVGVEQMKRLDSMLERRRTIAGRYQDAFAGHPHIQVPVEPDGCQSNWQSYMIGLRDGAPIMRDAFIEALDAKGIPTRRSIMASHLEPVYDNVPTSLPHTEDAFRRNVLLPIHNNLSADQQDYVIEAVKDALHAPE